MLKDLAGWLEVDSAKFRNIMVKILPLNMHQIKDVEFILGITADMNVKQARRQLNEEYSKWNSRATCIDPKVHSQADNMLNFIADARGEYTS